MFEDKTDETIDKYKEQIKENKRLSEELKMAH